jgi:hypothetical protein
MTQQLLIKSQTAGYYMTQNANQLLYSQTFDNAVWTLTNGTLTEDQTDSLGGATASILTATSANATLLQSLTLEGGTLNRTLSIGIKRKTGTGAVSITVDGTTYAVKTITGSWVRYETTLSASGTVTAGIKLATSGDEVYIEFSQFEDGEATAYLQNTANRFTVTQITDTDYPSNTVRGCAFLDGRFFVMTPAGEIQQSALEDASSWAALEFIQSQIDPGRGVYLTKHKNYIFALKDHSAEFFYDAANETGSILSPVQNAALPIGCASDGSVQEMAGTIVWMGQSKNGFGRSIYRLSDTSPEKISTPQIDKLLDSDDLATVHSWSATVGSHALYGITLVSSSITLAFDATSQIWSFFTYMTAGSVGAITAITALGVATSTAHGRSDGDIVLITGSGDFDGWHVVTQVTANTFELQATGTAFSGSASAQYYSESYFPVVSSVRANGRQYMQDESSGAIYELSQDAYIDHVGAIPMRVRTPKIDDGSSRVKTMPSVELVGDKVDATALVRYSNDDYRTSSNFRPIDLSLTRSRLHRLGAMNRRSFEILHVGNALVRLEAIELEG